MLLEYLVVLWRPRPILVARGTGRTTRIADAFRLHVLPALALVIQRHHATDRVLDVRWRIRIASVIDDLDIAYAQREARPALPPAPGEPIARVGALGHPAHAAAHGDPALAGRHVHAPVPVAGRGQYGDGRPAYGDRDQALYRPGPQHHSIVSVPVVRLIVLLDRIERALPGIFQQPLREAGDRRLDLGVVTGPSDHGAVLHRVYRG